MRTQSLRPLKEKALDVTDTPADRRRGTILTPKESIMSTNQAIAPVVTALTGLAARFVASSRRRRTERMMARFSNRELQDMGFERDWDGSAYRSSDYR
jgi:hypothetical protein